MTSMRIAGTAGLLMLLSGCGAIFNGTRQTISATSVPDQATVTVDVTQQKYTTPASISLERKRDYTLAFSKEGYAPASLHITHDLKGGILVLDIITGLVGVIVDAATGAWFSLNPSTAQITLTKTNALVPGPDSIHVGVARHGDRWRFESTAPVTVEVRRK